MQRLKLVKVDEAANNASMTVDGVKIIRLVDRGFERQDMYKRGPSRSREARGSNRVGKSRSTTKSLDSYASPRSGLVGVRVLRCL